MSLSKRKAEDLDLLSKISEAITPGYNTSTSQEAAKSIVYTAASLRGRIYWHLLNNGPKTSQELAAALMIPHNGVWQRMSELRAKGAVQNSGEKRLNRSGRRAIVWEVRSEEGLDPRLIEESKHSKESLRKEIMRLRLEIAVMKGSCSCYKPSIEGDK